jgi:hypothetical protein
MLQCSPNFNTQHLLSSFWRVPLKGRRGVRRTSYSRHSSISFRSRQKKNLGVMILTGEVYFGLIITTRSSHSRVFFFQIKSNAIIKSITQLSFTIWEWGRTERGKMVCSVFSKSACPWMLFSNGNGTRLLIEILSAVDREVCWLTKGGVICLTAVSSASYVCSIQRYIYALISVSSSWTFLSPRWHPSSSFSFRVTQTTKTNGIYLVWSLSSHFWTRPAPKSFSFFFLIIKL